MIVRLKFEPSGRPEGKPGEYYLTVKPNICVVCGVGEAYLRYPPDYVQNHNFSHQEKCGTPRVQKVLPCSHEGSSVSRCASNVSKKHLKTLSIPIAMKRVFRCVRCHQVSNLHDSRWRQQLADECGAPITSTSCTKVCDD